MCLVCSCATGPPSRSVVRARNLDARDVASTAQAPAGGSGGSDGTGMVSMHPFCVLHVGRRKVRRSALASASSVHPDWKQFAVRYPRRRDLTAQDLRTLNLRVEVKDKRLFRSVSL